MFGLSFQELMVVGVVAVLLFGKRLPEVARSLGQSYSQFRRGLSDIQNEMHRATDVSSSSSDSYASRDSYYNDDDYDQPTAPRFELPAPADSSAAADGEDPDTQATPKDAVASNGEPASEAESKSAAG